MNDNSSGSKNADIYINSDTDQQPSPDKPASTDTAVTQPQPFPETSQAGESKRNRARPHIYIGALLVFIVILVGAGTVFYLTRIRGSEASPSSETRTLEWREHVSANGYKLSFPGDHEVYEVGNETRVEGSARVVFVVKSLGTAALGEEVSALAENFEIEFETTEHVAAIGSRIGYSLDYEGVRYYYFPLANDKYLEIADTSPGSEVTERIIQSVEFLPDTTQAVN